jgi:spore coat protein CotH
MKRKYFFVVLFLILAIFLSGCSGGGIVTPATDEAKIKSVINEYFLALNDQNWSKAKSYCVYGSDIYYAICQMEDLASTIHTYCNTITVNAVVNILDVSISGNYSQAYCYYTYLITYCGYYENDSEYHYYDLQKVGNSWKLY